MVIQPQTVLHTMYNVPSLGVFSPTLLGENCIHCEELAITAG